MTGKGTIWTVTNWGAIHLLNLKEKEHHWEELEYQSLEFKRISSAPRSCWAVGGDHQVYVFVPSGDVPIRVAAVTFENERYNPFQGFTSNLLPTDRHHFSSEDGTVALPKESFLMPSRSWVWEGPWSFENNMEGEPLGPEGWMYAIDFPAGYGPEHKWNSLVRRRKWVRTKRYVAVNRWALIESIHGDHVAEPFIDVAVGGYEIPGGSQDHLVVWAVTILGRVMFREEVTALCPEGSGWQHIDTVSGNEINQVAVGPTGLAWAVSWDGGALVRTGVTRESRSGTGWIKVESPTESSKLLQVSVGVDVVWAVTRDYKVWFRKGIRGLNAGSNEKCATGCGWVEMVNEMSLVSVTPNDQVWGLSVDGKVLYFRTGISHGELTGKSWKPITKTPARGSVEPSSRMRSSTTAASDSISVSSMDSLGTSTGYEEDSVAWIWISASGCSFNADSYLGCLTLSRGSVSLSQSDVRSVNNGSAYLCESWRQTIINQFHNRFEREMKDFVPTYHQAIEKGTWIKSGNGLIQTKSLSGEWLRSHFELERHGVEKGTESGTLTCSFLSSKKQSSQKIVINLAEISCILTELNDENKNCSSQMLVIHRSMSSDESAIKLTFATDTEFDDWFATLNLACVNLHQLEGSVSGHPVLMWSISPTGDVYAGYSVNESGLFFRHLGGAHFDAIETCSAGVTWALSCEKTPYVYSGGYGGGVYKGISGANALLHPFSDTISMYVYENQRWNPLSGFSTTGLPTDRPFWSDESGKNECTKESARLPSKQWQWFTEWVVDYETPDGVDTNGWQYAPDFPFEYHNHCNSLTDYVRRRRWYRKCRITSTGPWMELESTSIQSLSIWSPRGAVDDVFDESVCVWAVFANGDALCRIGVTPKNPKGTSWIHVECEQHLKCVAVGGEVEGIKVWAVATDGSAFLRHGISATHPEGTVWFHVEPPRPKCPLLQMSVGCHTVMAVDQKSRLWYREEIVPTFPEGTHWRKVCDNVRHVCVAKNDLFWAILAVVEKKVVQSHVLGKRIGVDEDNKIGTHWEMTLENAFRYISIADPTDE